ASALEALRLRGTVYFQSDFRAPWGMAVPANNVAAFHVIASGECWLRGPGLPATRLTGGDIALLPHGNAHELVSSTDTLAVPAGQLLGEPRRGPDGEAAYGGEGESTRLVCGHFDVDQTVSHPLFTTLPIVLVVPTAEEEQTSWLATAAQLAAAESQSQQQGAAVVVDRLAEALLIQTLRLHLRDSPPAKGFLAAIAHPQIGQSLSRIHLQPERSWSIEELAQVAGLSRAVFAARFRELVGESPARYLWSWRMLAARRLLQNITLSTAQIAAEVGYQSEYAFAKAFKRYFGEGPGAARRSA
ncbi:MAG: AraC family transcriptional regulator, partial [Gemmatimonadetes bacterium]|nr:AraC family transcriptional regulator [Gemmatimonadota bacterium]